MGRGAPSRCNAKRPVVETQSDACRDDRRITYIVFDRVSLSTIERRIEITIGRIIGDHAFLTAGSSRSAYRLAGTQYNIVERHVFHFGHGASSIEEPGRNREIEDHLVSGYCLGQ